MESNFTNIELPTLKNVTELEAVSVMEKIHQETREDQNGKPYHICFIIRNDVEYRVPNSVISQVQELISKEGIKTFKVLSTGEGIKTKYSIKILE